MMGTRRSPTWHGLEAHFMKHFKLIFGGYLVTLVSACGRTLHAEDLSDEEKSAGYVFLFNGKDLTNWRFGEESPPEKMPENWKVEDGVIKVTGGGNPHLASAKEYGDFEFRFEWRGTRPKYNSGLFIRSGK